MNFRRIIIHGLLYGPYIFHKITGAGAFGPHGATYLEGPVPDGNNPLKAALFKHHVKQFLETACSVASVVTVVNAFRDIQGDRTDPITQMDILEKVRTGYWKERMSPGGHNGRRGLPLPLLGEIVKSSLDAYGLAYKTVETVHGTKDHGQAQKQKESLRNRLVDFETRGNCLIIAHFDQGAFVRTLNIPHISPVGQFNTQTGEVTVLDVDPEQDRFYKVPFDTFCKGLFSNYHPILRPFGYQTGGYVCLIIN
ncbi:MAG: hypothetical protein JW902_10100 [Syntrophaceae bacterium]|nr:hypothetical protein [Syntrophaceae bacterium]